jgi:hypothetical protein
MARSRNRMTSTSRSALSMTSDRLLAMKNTRNALILVALIAGSAMSPAAEAQDSVHPYLTDKFALDLGIFFPDRQISLSVDGPLVGIEGEDIDFETAFGHKRSDDVFSLNFGWRFGEKWQLGGQYFASSGENSKVLEEDVEWNDITFGQGTGIAVGQDFDLVRVFFARRFKSSDNQEFGLGLGIHWLQIGAWIEGNAVINGVPAGFKRESVKADAPLPNIGAWYIYSFSPKWALRARLDWLSAKVGEYDGTLINASAGLSYQLSEHVGLGLSYNLFDLDIDVNKRGWHGNVNTSYKGAFVHMSLFW